MLRGALESGAQLEYVVDGSLYQTALQEANMKFNKVSFKKPRRQLGNLGKTVERLWGKISERASHSTERRFRLLDYELDGKQYDRVGLSVQPGLVEHILYIAMLCLMQLTCSLNTAYVQEGRNMINEHEVEGTPAWKDRFEAICSKFGDQITQTV